MQKPYYLFNPGRASRRDNTLKFTPVNEAGETGEPRYLPIEGIKALYVFGALDINASLLNFLGQQSIPIHFFDPYDHYTGSFMPRDYLHAGKVLVAQTRHYLEYDKRLLLAQKFVIGAAANIRKNLSYYQGRGRDLETQRLQVEELATNLPTAQDVPALMGIEGNIRQYYYSAFDEILNDFEMGGRSFRPPLNEVNALISFGNALCYSLCLDAIYHTQLNPTLSYLHEPGARRYSLALDLAEIFKPILVDRSIFALLNKKQIQPTDFEHTLNSCLLKEKGKKTFVQAWEDRLNETIKHRSLGRSVSYRRLVQLECYKLVKHVMEIETYEPFKAWW